MALSISKLIPYLPVSVIHTVYMLSLDQELSPTGSCVQLDGDASLGGSGSTGRLSSWRKVVNGGMGVGTRGYVLSWPVAVSLSAPCLA